MREPDLASCQEENRKLTAQVLRLQVRLEEATRERTRAWDSRACEAHQPLDGEDPLAPCHYCLAVKAQDERPHMQWRYLLCRVSPTGEDVNQDVNRIAAQGYRLAFVSPVGVELLIVFEREAPLEAELEGGGVTGTHVTCTPKERP